MFLSSYPDLEIYKFQVIQLQTNGIPGCSINHQSRLSQLQHRTLLSFSLRFSRVNKITHQIRLLSPQSEHFKLSKKTFISPAIKIKLQLQLIMIKSCCIKLNKFSTIRFPQKYRQAFKITHEIRYCKSIKQLEQYLEREKHNIIKYGKTQVLQYFNQYPINFNDSQTKFLLFTNQFQDLNLYEQQLRLRCMIKLFQYSPTSSAVNKKIVKKAQDSFLEKVLGKTLDPVDAINTIVQKTYWSRSQLLDKALQILFRKQIPSSTMIQKCIFMIMKRFQDISWGKLRVLKPLLSFVCQFRIIKSQDLSHQIIFLSRLCSIQLHKMGYDNIPAACKSVYDAAKQYTEPLDNVSIQTLFKMLALLPREFCFSYYKNFLTKVIQIQIQCPIYPQMLPYSRMTVQELEILINDYSSKWIKFINVVFFLNRPAAIPFVYNSCFMKRAFEQLRQQVESPTKSRLLKEFSCYLAFTAVLLQFYKDDSAKCSQIVNLFQTVTSCQVYRTYFGLALSELSLCNFLNLLSIHYNNHVYSQVKIVERLIEQQIDKFRSKFKDATYFKSRGFCQQMIQAIVVFCNNQNPAILSVLASIVQTNFSHQVTNTNIWNQDFKAAVIFGLFNSYYYETFQAINNKLCLFFQNEIMTFAELYLIYPNKTQTQTIKVLSKICQKQYNFSAVAKILAYQESINLTNQKGQLNSKLRQILFGARNFINKRDIQLLSLGEIHKMLIFCNHFANEAKEFAKACLLRSVDILEQHLKNHGVNYQVFTQMLYLCNKLQVPALHLVPFIRKILQMAQKQINQQQACLESYQLFIQASKFFQTNPQVVEKIIHKITNEINNSSLALKNHKIQLPLLLRMIFSCPLNLTDDGYNYLKKMIKANLLSQQILPIHLKNQVYLQISNMSRLPLPKLHFLKDIFQFCLNQVEIQQGPQFYYWCLKLSHSLNKLQIEKLESNHMIVKCLDLVPLNLIDFELLIKILAIIRNYPQLLSTSFNSRLLNALKTPGLNLASSYIHILQYFSLLYYQVPQQILQVFQRLLRNIQNFLMKRWQQLEQKKNQAFYLQNYVQILNKSYTYFRIIIKSDINLPQTLKIYSFCCKAKVVAQKHIGKNILQGQNLQLQCLIDTYLELLPKSIFANARPIKTQPSQRQKKPFFKPKQKKEIYTQKQPVIQDVINLGKIQAFPKYLCSPELALVESEFQTLELKKSQAYLSNQNFYTRDFNFRGIKISLFLRFNNKNYCIITVRQKLKNQVGLIGQLHIYQKLYKKIFGFHTLFINSENIPKETKELIRKLQNDH